MSIYQAVDALGTCECVRRLGLLVTIRTTHRPASDLGYLLHKNPARVQTFDQSFGRAVVFCPEASTDACTAALLLDVDSVGLVRGRSREDTGPLAQYVNDRPYVASSFLSVAIGHVFRSAMAGRSEERPDLADAAIPLQVRIAVLPCRGGESLLRRLFEPLGYVVQADELPLDATFPEWGPSRYFAVTLDRECRLRELLTHLYVLVPVLDDQKHYFVGQEELEKLLRHGEGWLEAHPERDTIVRRYVKYRRDLVREAIGRLLAEEAPEADGVSRSSARDAEENSLEKPLALNEQRLSTVAEAIKRSGAKRVLDLGCGEGRLLQLLLEERQFDEIVGMDVSYRTLQFASERLGFERLAPMQRRRINLIHGSLVYRDARLVGFDAAALVEVIEHLDRTRLATCERVVFEFAQPSCVIVTTPNAEYNVNWATLPAGQFRHKDHRFEWTRREFAAWANSIANRHGYVVDFQPVGEPHPVTGPPTQMAVFNR
jgi:3' terminal RNA ribose 2'-O-methyltransferase Hen1